MLYEFGRCRLEDTQRVLTREGQRVPLPPKTFDLLLFLVRGSGRAFSKQELLSALWPDAFVEEANLFIDAAHKAHAKFQQSLNILGGQVGPSAGAA